MRKVLAAHGGRIGLKLSILFGALAVLLMAVPVVATHGGNCSPSQEIWHDSNDNADIRDFTPAAGTSGWCASALDRRDDWEFNGQSDDLVYMGAGHDNLEGGPLSDRLAGNGNDDVIKGEDGDDDIYDGSGSDELWPGAGNDTWHPCNDGQSDGVVGDFENITAASSANCDGPGSGP